MEVSNENNINLTKNRLKILIAGLIIGFLSGLFSSGGGLIAIPAFTHLFKLQPKEARAMTIFCILPMVITSLFFYNQANYIDIKSGILCGIGGVIGGVIGSSLLGKIRDKYLQIIFIIFIIYSAIMIFRK